MIIVETILLSLIYMIGIGIVMFFPVFIYIIKQQRKRVNILEGARSYEKRKRTEWMILALNYKSINEALNNHGTVPPSIDEEAYIMELQAREFILLTVDELKDLMDHYSEEEDYLNASVCRDRIKVLEQGK